MDNLIEKFSPVLRQYWLPLVLCLAGLIFLGYGLVGYFAGQNRNKSFGAAQDKPDILFEAASDVADVKKVPIKTIVVDVEGAVEKPGVYKLEAGSRIQDALIEAGGLGEDADRETVEKSLNLASKLVDGGKVYIPYEGESVEVYGSTAVMGDATKLTDVNSASEAELDKLPGIGKTTAEKIVSNRPYGKIEDLIDKKVVGRKVFEDIKGKITVN